MVRMFLEKDDSFRAFYSKVSPKATPNQTTPDSKCSNTTLSSSPSSDTEEQDTEEPPRDPFAHRGESMHVAMGFMERSATLRRQGGIPDVDLEDVFCFKSIDIYDETLEDEMEEDERDSVEYQMDRIENALSRYLAPLRSFQHLFRLYSFLHVFLVLSSIDLMDNSMSARESAFAPPEIPRFDPGNSISSRHTGTPDVSLPTSPPRASSMAAMSAMTSLSRRASQNVKRALSDVTSLPAKVVTLKREFVEFTRIDIV